MSASHLNCRQARITINTTIETRNRVAEKLLEMGFQFGEDSPAWGKFFAAIENGDVLIYKKIN